MMICPCRHYSIFINCKVCGGSGVWETDTSDTSAAPQETPAEAAASWDKALLEALNKPEEPPKDLNLKIRADTPEERDRLWELLKQSSQG